MPYPTAQSMSRRSFLAGAAVALPATCSLAFLGCGSDSAARGGRTGALPVDEADDAGSVGMDSLFRISLAQWSLHRSLAAGELDHLDFPRVARTEYGVDAVEYVNTFFGSLDQAYLPDLRSRCESHGVRSLLIMCDGEGAIGDPDSASRTRAVENHYPWVEAASFLGCHSIRVNAQSQGTPETQRDLASDGLHRLAEFADPAGINVLVENHGGLSSNGAWLASVMEAVDHPRCGTLPDFGNFDLGNGRRYDPYQGVEELMPYAKAVSAKSHVFDEEGREAELDYHRLLRTVLNAGYRGYVGIEYEGSDLEEPEGIRATKRLLERVRTDLASEFSERG